MPRSENHQEGGGPPCVVMESGSGSIKIGWSGEPEPRGVLPCAGLEEAGDARPFRDGRVADWECLEAYWDHAFTNLLNIDTEKCHLLVSCALHETKDNRERMIQTLFETFAAPHVYIGSPPVFEMYAYGRENGVVLGSGAQCTYAVLVHEGLPDPRTLLRSSVAGETLTKWSAHVLQQAAGGGAAAVPDALACAVKERQGAASADAAPPPQKFSLPDGKSITLTREQQAQLAEPLFNPSLVGEASGGIANLVGDCLKARDRDGAIESDVFGVDGTAAWFDNIVLAGGSTMFAGLPERLEAELQLRTPGAKRPKIAARPERKHAAWVGASMLGSLSVMSQMWVSKEEYDETGPLIVNRKCF